LETGIKNFRSNNLIFRRVQKSVYFIMESQISVPERGSTAVISRITPNRAEQGTPNARSNVVIPVKYPNTTLFPTFGFPTRAIRERATDKKGYWRLSAFYSN